MRKPYYLIYLLMVVIYPLPFIPMSVKGIFGFSIILWSCVKLGLRSALITAFMCIVLGITGELLFQRAPMPQLLISILFGTTAYIFVAYYFGRYSESLKEKNQKLTEEIRRREKAENDLNEKLEQMKIMMDTIPNPIYFKDMDNRFMACNRAFTESTSITEAELIGRTPEDFESLGTSEKCRQADDALLAGEGLQTFEETLVFADGSIRNAILNKAIFLDKDRKPAGTVCVLTDVTVQKEAEKLKQSILESKQLMEQMVENDKLKTEFFSTISHEFRTPLNVILGSLQLMELYLTAKQYPVSREKIIKKIAILKQNSYRLLRLVNNLIDISRIDANAFEMHFRNCDIVALIRDITRSVAEYTENKGIHVSFHSDMESRTVACDDEKIERILLNLLSNAIKFTLKDGTISVGIKDQQDGLCILVEDNGIGIPADKQNQIFQRFCQIDRIFTRQHEGSGIGLNLVKSLVEMHGGTISFTSVFGKGTSFFIYLPYNDIDEEVLKYNITGKHPPAHTSRIPVEFSDLYTIGKQ